MLKYAHNILLNKTKPQDSYRNFNTSDGDIILNNEQFNIVTEDINKKIRIIACAGSGKTTTIICRIKYLVDNGIDPQRIILTTFNVDASESMKKRILKVFGYMPKITIGTIDSIACKFYMQYFKKDYYIGVSEYTTELSTYLKSPMGVNITNNYDYLFFDEFQDCNNIQFEILKAFDKASCKITVIGDDAQNIYQWRGSNIDYILNYETHIENTVTHKLVNNYRSTPEIINLANASISHNTDQIPKDMLPTNSSINEKPKIVKHMSENIQAEEIIKKILYYNSLNIKFESISVISRINYPLKIIEEELEKYNRNHIDKQIPYVALITDDIRDSKPKICESHICLTTIHKSKGLEWDVVILVSCNDEIFPTKTDKISLEEERRLFYVGVTRAKRYLTISFTSNSLSRFVSELPTNLYEFPNMKQKYLVTRNERDIKLKTSVSELIEMLESKDIEHMRLTGIIPNMNPVEYKVHIPFTYNQIISKYYLQTDFGQFIDRFLCREFGYQNSSTGGLNDNVACRVINSLTLPYNELSIYLKYNININKKLHVKHFNMNLDTICKYLDKDMMDPQYVKKIDAKDIYNLKKVLGKIIKICLDYNLLPQNVFVVPESYIPSEFFPRMQQSYEQYQNVKLPTIEILKSIYDVSICQNIYDGRRRLLYKNVQDEFIENLQMFEEMIKWVIQYKNDDITIKLCMNDTKNLIDGELDMYNSTTMTVVDFKTSTSSSCKLEWVIQLLTYTSLLRTLKKVDVKYIMIYNPLQGITSSFDVSEWNKENELLEYLALVRNTRLQRNK